MLRRFCNRSKSKELFRIFRSDGSRSPGPLPGLSQDVSGARRRDCSPPATACCAVSAIARKARSSFGSSDLTAADLLGRYLDFLKTSQGLADATVVLRRLHVAPFLQSLEKQGALSDLPI